MRNSKFFFTVLSLFLLVPASITWAQMVSVSGNVYEKNTVKNSFKTSQGIITTFLPDDMAADDVISGTVLYEPAGSNRKKKNDNLQQLVKYTLFLESGTPIRANVNDDGAADLISESPIRRRISFTIPASIDQSSLHLYLKDGGNNIIGESKLPLIDKSILIRHRYLDIGDVKSKEAKSTIQTDKKIYTSGENAVIYLPLVFGVINMENTFVECWYSFNGWKESEPVKIDLPTLVGSPRKTVVQIPPYVYGPGEIMLEDKNKKVIALQKIHVLKLDASCPKTGLIKGEQTMLNVTVKGLKDCPVDYLRLTLDNTTSGFVQLGQSNHEELILETVSMNYSKIKWDYKPQDKKVNTETVEKNREKFESYEFSLQRSVTALQSGAFILNVGLSYPSSVYNDPFRQQLDVLKTPEQFNNWQNALKTDLARNQTLGEHIMDGVISHRLLPTASSADLDEAKSRIYSIINIPRIGQEVVVANLGCTLEAGNAAVQNAISNPGNAPVNIVVIQSAIKYAEHQAAISENKLLKDAVIDINKDLSKLQKEINDVSQQLQILNNIQKVFYDVSKAAVNNMRTSTTGNTVSKVIRDGKLTDNEYLNLTYEILPANEFQIELGMGPIPGSLRDLMNSFITGQSVKKSGSFIAADMNTNVNSKINFKNSLISEISFPGMDAKSKNTPMTISLKFKPEEISFKKETDKITEPLKPDNKKQWMPSNFKIEIEGLPCNEIKRVESFKITQKNVEEKIGPVKNNKIVPGKMEYPNLVFYVPDFDSESWKYWFSNFEKQKVTEEKKGSIRYFDNNSKQVFALSFKNIIPVSIQPSRGPHPGGTYTVIVNPGTTMLGYEVSPDPLLNINASTYVSNEIAGNPCNPEGAKTISWLYIEKPCRVEMKTTRSENVSPESDEILDEIADLLGEVSEEGAKMGTRLAKAFSITKSFAIWIEVVRDWESYKAEYVCKNGVWQHGEMYLVNSGTKQVTYWERLTDESGQSSWTKDDDMGWIWRKANEIKNKACK